MFQLILLVSKSMLLFILFSVSFIICLPVFVYRWVLSILVPIFHPIGRISTIVFGQDHLLLCSQMATNVMTTFKVEGACNLAALKEAILHRMVYARSKGHGPLLYPELQQYPTRVGGYFFWTWEEDFNIDDHVSVYKHDRLGKITKQEEITELETNYLASKFEEGKSQWNFLVVDNIELDDAEERDKKEPYYLLILKFHHSLADGNSFLGAYLKLDGQEANGKFSASSKQSSKMLKVKKTTNIYCQNKPWAWLWFPFHSIYDLLRQITFFHEKCGQLQLSTSTSTSNKGFVVRPNAINVPKIKSLAARHKVQFSSIVLAGLAGGFRKYLLSTGRSRKESDLPENLMTLAPVIMDNTTRADGLGNDTCVVGLPMPLRNSDSTSRLHLINAAILDRTSSPQPYFTNALMKWVGLLPVYNVRGTLSSLNIVWSSFAGPLTCMTIAGQTVQGINYRAIGSDDLSVSITCYSYASNLETILTLNSALCSTQAEGTLLVKFIQEEFDNIDKIATTNTTSN